MKKFNNIFSGKVLAGLAAIGLLVTSCVYLDSIEYPDQLVAGEVAEFTMNVHVEAATEVNDERLIIGVLVPSSWNPASNMTLTYTSSVDTGTKTMTLIPNTVLPAAGDGATWPEHLHNKFGVGPNENDDMQWVAFQSDATYDLVDNDIITAEVKIQVLVGDENLKAQLGFFINNSGDGLSPDTERWKVEYSDCMTVTGATGTLTDYCTGEISGINPVQNKVSGAPYPNPFTDKVSFPLNLAAGTDFEVNVFDVTGKKVKSYKETTTDNNQVFSLDSKSGMQDLNAGLYLVSVKSNKGTSNFKVVKS